jgi:hypothetical protein
MPRRRKQAGGRVVELEMEGDGQGSAALGREIGGQVAERHGGKASGKEHAREQDPQAGNGRWASERE